MFLFYNHPLSSSVTKKCYPQKIIWILSLITNWAEFRPANISIYINGTCIKIKVNIMEERMHLSVERINWIWPVRFWTFLFVLKWWGMFTCMPFAFVVLSNNVIKYFNNIQNAVSDKHCWKRTDGFEMTLLWRRKRQCKVFYNSKNISAI